MFNKSEAKLAKVEASASLAKAACTPLASGAASGAASAAAGSLAALAASRACTPLASGAVSVSGACTPLASRACTSLSLGSAFLNAKACILSTKVSGLSAMELDGPAAQRLKKNHVHMERMIAQRDEESLQMKRRFASISKIPDFLMQKRVFCESCGRGCGCGSSFST